MDLSVVVPEEKRSKTVQELYTSEVLYVSNLKDMIEGFIVPLREKNIIPSSAVSGIFSNVETIFKFHDEFFLPQLKREITVWSDNSLIGDIFLSLAPCFKLYTQYCSNYDKSIGQVQQHKKSSPEFQTFLAEAQNSDRFHGSYITSMLILPIQRIPRYQMFLQELVKRTAEDHPDYATLNTALQSVAKQAAEVDEACNKAENILKIMEISKSIGLDNLLKPGRTYIREDDVTEFKMESSSTVNHKCYVFNDILILSSEKKSKKTNVSAPVHLCWVRDLEEEDCSQIITPGTTYLVRFKSKAIKQAWVKQFSGLLKQLINGREGQTILKKRGSYHVQDSRYPGIFIVADDKPAASPGGSRKKGKWGTLFKKKGSKIKPKKEEPEAEVEVTEEEAIETTGRRNSLPHEGAPPSDPIQRTKFTGRANICSSDSGVSMKREIRRSTSVVNNKHMLLNRQKSSSPSVV